MLIECGIIYPAITGRLPVSLQTMPYAQILGTVFTQLYHLICTFNGKSSASSAFDRDEYIESNLVNTNIYFFIWVFC